MSNSISLRAEIVQSFGYQLHGSSTRRGLHELSGVVGIFTPYTAASFYVHVCVDFAVEDINIMYIRTTV